MISVSFVGFRFPLMGHSKSKRNHFLGIKKNVDRGKNAPIKETENRNNDKPEKLMRFR